MGSIKFLACYTFSYMHKIVWATAAHILYEHSTTTNNNNTHKHKFRHDFAKTENNWQNLTRNRSASSMSNSHSFQLQTHAYSKMFGIRIVESVIKFYENRILCIDSFKTIRHKRDFDRILVGYIIVLKSDFARIFYSFYSKSNLLLALDYFNAIDDNEAANTVPAWPSSLYCYQFPQSRPFSMLLFSTAQNQISSLYYPSILISWKVFLRPRLYACVYVYTKFTVHIQ